MRCSLSNFNRILCPVHGRKELWHWNCIHSCLWQLFDSSSAFELPSNTGQHHFAYYEFPLWKLWVFTDRIPSLQVLDDCKEAYSWQIENLLLVEYGRQIWWPMTLVVYDASGNRRLQHASGSIQSHCLKLLFPETSNHLIKLSGIPVRCFSSVRASE